MSAQAEARVRRALESLSIASTTAAEADEEDDDRARDLLAEAKLCKLYDDLLSEGFGVRDVENALTDVVTTRRRATDETEAAANPMGEALDWLCYNVPTERLPRRYQGAVRTAAAFPGSEGAAVEVLVAAEEQDPDAAAAAAAAAAEARERAAVAAAAEKAAEKAAARAEADAERRKRDAEEAARANREWIMRQYEEASDGDGSDGTGSDHDSLEDYGLTEEEIERKATARRRRRAFDADRDAHIAVMRREMDEARAEAAAGKVTRDKARQKRAGELVRRVKEEMAAYGLVDEDLHPPPPPPSAPATAEESNGVEGTAAGAAGDADGLFRDSGTTRAHGEGEGSGPGAGADASRRAPDAGGGGGGDAGDAGREPDDPTSTASKKEDDDDDDDDDGGFGLDLFDGGDETAAIMGEDTGNDAAVFELSEAPLFPPTHIAAKPAAGAGGKKGGKKGGNAPAAAVFKVETVAPKALLQMLCRREGWLAPRYDKAGPSGGGGGGGGTAGAAVGAVVRGMTYAVTVERTGSGKRVGGGSAAKAAARSTITCSSGEEDAPPGGWETVNDAQNAAAARALFLAVGTTGATSATVAGLAPMPSELPAEFKMAWRRWAEEVFDAAAAAAAGGGGDAGGPGTVASARDDFVRRLSRGAGGKRRGVGADADEAPKESWDDGDGEDDAAPGVASRRKSIGERSPAARPAAAAAANASAFAETSERLKRDAATKRSDAAWQKMRAFRENLPVAALRDNLLRALRERDAAVVCGETGSGKTTQVPQYLLDDAVDAGAGAGCRVICTQPRRVAALTVAERVASERCERGGVGGKGSLVGHHVRLDAAVTKDTRLTFMTAGILLRRMHGDPLLAEVSHVVLDEIHERSLDGDFLLALLRTLPARRRELGMAPLKLIVMSAALDANLFCGYLDDCPVVQAAGRTHPVSTVYLEDIHDMLEYALDEESRCCRRPRGDSRGAAAIENMDRREKAAALDSWGVDDAWRGDENPDYDPTQFEHVSALTRRNLSRLDENVIDYDIIEKLLGVIDDDAPHGAMLVFLPGIGEVSGLIDRLASNPRFAPRHGKHKLVPLHSALTPAEQREAFKTHPVGVRKIVVATNVAETSVTIEDVVVVIDSGRVKERQWDARRGMASLLEGWVSRAAARQRAGRAGRVRAGTCYALFTSHRARDGFRSHQVPEMHRVPLTEIVLQIKKLDVDDGAEAFLAGSLEPPAPEAVVAALNTLREVGAVDASEAAALTPLGHHLAALPVDCRVAKMLVYGALLSCLSPVLTIAACLSYKSPFTSGQGGKGGGGAAAGDAARRQLSLPSSGCLASGEQSDHLVYAAAYENWAKVASVSDRNTARRHATKHGLCPETLKQIAEMRGQYASLLADIGFIAGSKGTRADASPSGWVDDPSASWNVDAKRAPVVKAVVTAGLYANIAATENTGRWRDAKGEVGVHPSSVNAKLATPTFPFLVFHEKVKTSRVFLRDSTVVAPAALLLFGGAMDVHHAAGRVSLDGWLWLRASAQVAVLFKKLRRALDDELDARIRGARRVRDGGPSKGAGAEDILRTIRTVLTEHGCGSS